jgi:EAL domain-containing protein (putative c-di-GMP-specific phosphodiesterase class I)
MSIPARKGTLSFPTPEERARPAVPLLSEANVAGNTQHEWLLESRMDGGRQLRQIPIAPIPFRIGRMPGLDLVLPSQLVSKTHAEISEANGALRLRDLRSTNGTFVNRQPATDVSLQEGDIVHFADFEFRVGRRERVVARNDSDRGTHSIGIGALRLPQGLAEGTREMRELLEEGAVSVVFQPIVRLPGGQVEAYEVLGRGAHPKLPEDPEALFKIAAGIGKAAQLSRLLRKKAVEVAKLRPDIAPLFLNTHPAEMEEPGLLESLEELRRSAPHLQLTLEIHESALAQPQFIAWLRTKLTEINVGIAYDDFGAGQARLLELAEAPPHYLKFDRRFICGIDTAPPSRRRLLASLVAAARELLVKTVAEGCETAAEVEVCTAVGFTHAQGYYFARPVPLAELGS